MNSILGKNSQQNTEMKTVTVRIHLNLLRFSGRGLQCQRGDTLGKRGLEFPGVLFLAKRTFSQSGGSLKTPYRAMNLVFSIKRVLQLKECVRVLLLLQLYRGVG